MRVMIVTHDQTRRLQVSEFLRHRGYDVQIPPRRQDVVPMARDAQPEVLVLDLYVSGPSGIEILRMLRGEGYRGRVVALTGSSLKGVHREALSLGVAQVVGGLQAVDGPVDPSHVEAAIREASKAQPQHGS